MSKTLQAIELGFNSAEDMRLDCVIDDELYMYRGPVPDWFLTVLGNETRAELQTALEEYEQAQKKVKSGAISQEQFDQLDLKMFDIFEHFGQSFEKERIDETIDALINMIDNTDEANQVFHFDKEATENISSILAQYQNVRLMKYRAMMAQPMEQRDNVDLDDEVKKQLALSTGKGSA